MPERAPRRRGAEERHAAQADRSIGRLVPVRRDRAVVHHRSASARAPVARAEPPRPPRGAEHGGFRLGLSRLAARRSRPRAVARRQVPRRRADPLPAGPERRPRGDLDLGRAASEPVRGRALRRRVRHVVRQGARRRSLRRSVQARQRGRDVASRRRARGRGRRPHLQVVVAAAPERVRIHRRLDAGIEPGQRRGDRRARSLRLRVVAVQRLLGRAQGHAGDGRRDAELRAAAAGARRS